MSIGFVGQERDYHLPISLKEAGYAYRHLRQIGSLRENKLAGAFWFDEYCRGQLTPPAGPV